MKILKVLGILVLFVIIIAVSGALYINFALPDTGAPEDIKIAADSSTIERGRYLANHVTACMDCHSTRDWGLYAGPMVAGTVGRGGEVFDDTMGFPGKMYASNITPHALANWTDGELLRAITTGVNKDGKALFPVMSYARFGKMDREDIYSIIAYLRSIEPVASTIPETQLDFPVNLINNTMPAKASFTKRPKETDSIRYGGYLANAAGCVDCHSKTDKGQVIPGSEYGGGMEFKQPAGILRSPNITFHQTNGIGSWTKDTFVQRFKTYADSNYKAQKVTLKELNTSMPWSMYAGMKTGDLEALYVYLKSLKRNSNKVILKETHPRTNP